MEIAFEVDHSEQEVLEAYADTYGYRKEVLNAPRPPEPTEKSTPEEVAAYESWTEYIPNPQSKLEFMQAVFRDRVDEVVAGFRVRKAKHDNLHPTG